MVSRLLTFALVFALPLAASAQVTAHKVTLKLKGVSQTTNDAGDLRPDKFSADWKDVFQACVGRAPEKDEGIYVFIDCNDLGNNTILAMDTDPVSVISSVGSLGLELSDGVLNEKSGTLKSLSVPAALDIDCDGASVEARGILDLKFKDLDGEQCVDSGGMKMTGRGEEIDDFIVDDGSSISAKKRSAAFGNQFPPPQ